MHCFLKVTAQLAHPFWISGLDFFNAEETFQKLGL